MHVQFVEPVNDPVKAKNYPVNDLVNEPAKRNILQHLKQNPKANYKELADKTGYLPIYFLGSRYFSMLSTNIFFVSSFDRPMPAIMVGRPSAGM